MTHTRREFMSTSGSALSGAWLTRFLPFAALTQACATEARLTGTFVTFSEGEAATFDALAARIVPSDDTPGAREAGSVYFADQALSNHMSDFLPLIRGGIQDLDQRAAASGAASFADLEEDGQDAIITSIEQENPPFFFFARTLTVLGLVTNPEYGGNRDKVGWSLIGFEDTYRYEPPFGYYDRDEHGTSGAEGDR
jgi:gluconate 2-dehydrogenase gamma chain